MKAKPGIVLRDGQYLVDGKPFFMYAGEFHYFRVAATDWESRLKKAKQLGLNTISSYIPWGWHEPVEGQPDFTGQTHPQRNLIKFLDLVGKAGLKFFARPGPITHGELRNDGLPTWLVEKPGGVCIQGEDGDLSWCPSLPAFFKPIYLENVKRWYQAVMPILKKYQANNQGPIIQIQLDNEIHMVNWLGKLADYSPETNQRYQGFLRERYQTVAALNQAYGTAHADFEQVTQPAGNTENENWQRLWDWARYYRDHYAGYFEYLHTQMRAQGLDTAVSANIAQFVDFNMYGRGWESIANTSVFREFSRKVPDTIFGGAFQMRHLDFENYHDIIYTTAALKSITAEGLPVNCAELQVGVMNDRPRIYASDVELNLKTATAHGLNGVNGYMTFSGITPDEIVLRGNYHEWQAPVDSQGNFREHAEPLQRFGKWVKHFGEQLAQTRNQHDITIGFDPHYYFTEFMKDGFYSQVQRRRNQDFFDGSARILALLGFNPDLLDLERADLDDLLSRPVIWLFSLDFMSRPVMEKLADYVERGGRLVLNPLVPDKNTSMRPDTFLLDRLGLRVETVQASNNLYRYKGMQYLVESDMTIFNEQGADVWLRHSEGGACCVRRKVGQGEVMALGFGLYHQYDYMVELVRDLALKFKLTPALRKDNWSVHAALRTRGESGWLYLANFHDTPSSIALEYTVPGKRPTRRFPAKGRVCLPNRSAYFLPLNLPLTADLTIETAGCEVLEFNDRKKAKQMELTIRGLPDQLTQIVFNTTRRIRKMKLDDNPLVFKATQKSVQVNFTSSGQLQNLTLWFK